jgi:hypothetical protein
MDIPKESGHESPNKRYVTDQQQNTNFHQHKNENFLGDLFGGRPLCSRPQHPAVIKCKAQKMIWV